MQELNRQMMTLPELRELEEIIRFGTGPAAVSGVSGVHRAMLGAALRQETKRPLAVLCADEQEARRMAADLAALTGEECVTLFAREWQLRDRVSASHSFEQERLDALCRMAFGRTGIVVATVDGMLQRTLPAVDGSCQWYAKAVCDNPGGYGTMLRTVYHSTPALQPLMPWIDRKAPKKVRKPAVIATGDGPALMWTAPKAKRPTDEAVRYAVYRFAPGERVSVKDAVPVAVTAHPYYLLPAEVADRTVFCVTAVDRLGNESKPVKVKF